MKYEMCPFCGQDLNDYPEVMIIQKEVRKILPDYHQVQCPRCGAHGGGGWIKEEAIQKWNRREKKSTDTAVSAL